MTTQIPRTVLLGDLVAAAFDKAADYDTDPVKISALATRAVAHILGQSRRVAHEKSTRQKTRIDCGGTGINVRPLED